MGHIGMLFPCKIVLEVTIRDEKNWEQTQFPRYCLSVLQRLHSFQGWCFVPHTQYWKHQRQDTQMENSFSVISICHHTLVWQSSHNTLIAYWFDMTNWHHMTNANDWKLAVHGFPFHSKCHCHFVSCIMVPFSLYRNHRFVYATRCSKNICIP